MPKPLSENEFFRRCRLRYNDFFSYTHSVFLGTTKPIELTCPKHGKFTLKKAAKHLYFSHGCDKCANEAKKEQFISRCELAHDFKYDYSQSSFTNQHEPFEFICPIHGKRTQRRAQQHLNHGCEKCGGTQKLTLEEFITRSNIIHQNQYIYEEVVYKTARKKVTITCPTHGNFLQYPYAHLAGNGCYKCARPIHNLASFLLLANKVHGKKYRYKNVNFLRSDLEVQIDCEKHGPFFQKPTKHIHAEYGCNSCGNETTGLKKRKSRDEFVKQAILMHGQKYSYEFVDYLNSAKEIDIFCPKHGIFSQTPSIHLKGSGCGKCGAQQRGKLKSQLAKELFVPRAKKIHGDFYNYDRVNYQKSDLDVEIFCQSCKNYFPQQPSNHLQGNGCPNCAEYGFNALKPAILYYLKICELSKIFYKIGITNRSVEQRFRGDDIKKITKLREWKFEQGRSAADAERRILKKYKAFRRNYSGILSRGGNTELFEIDVLGLDEN